MQTLPVTPVETFARTRTAPAPHDVNRNPGIVPPWLQGHVTPDVPVGDDVPRILGNDAITGYDPTPVEDDAATTWILFER